MLICTLVSGASKLDLLKWPASGFLDNEVLITSLKRTGTGCLGCMNVGDGVHPIMPNKKNGQHPNMMHEMS